MIHVILGEETMQQVDTPLAIGIVGRHIWGSNGIVDTPARTPDRSDNVIASSQLGDIFSHGLYAAEVLMPKHQKLVSLRRGTVFGGVDFSVRTIHSDPQHPHQDASTAL